MPGGALPLTIKLAEPEADRQRKRLQRSTNADTGGAHIAPATVQHAAAGNHKHKWSNSSAGAADDSYADAPSAEIAQGPSWDMYAVQAPGPAFPMHSYAGVPFAGPLMHMNAYGSMGYYPQLAPVSPVSPVQGMSAAPWMPHGGYGAAGPVPYSMGPAFGMGLGYGPGVLMPPRAVMPPFLPANAAPVGDDGEMNKVLVENLPPGMRDADLWLLASNFGAPLSARVLVDTTSAASGMSGTVTFLQPASVHSAVSALHGMFLAGHQLSARLHMSMGTAGTTTPRDDEEEQNV
jgi:hypothetical protein